MHFRAAQICVPIELAAALPEKARSLDPALQTLESAGVQFSKLIFDNQYGIDTTGAGHASIIFVGKRFVSDQSNFQTLIDISVPRNGCTQKLSRNEQRLFNEQQFQFADTVLKHAKYLNSQTGKKEVNSAEVIPYITQTWQSLQHCSPTSTSN